MIVKKDILVIGSGPAGLQTGYFCKKNNLDYLILEKKDKLSGFFRQFPIHRHLISINKVNVGDASQESSLKWDWNSLLNDEGLRFTQYSKDYFPSAEILINYLEDFQKLQKLNIEFNREVVRISKKASGEFLVETRCGSMYESRLLLLSTGFAKPFIPNIPGIEYAENYTELDITSSKYDNKKVCIIGKGNSAFEAAKGLLNKADVVQLVSPSPLRQATHTHYVGAVRSINDLTTETYQLKGNNALVNAEIGKIEKKDGKLYVTYVYKHADQFETVAFDHVICCCGFKMDNGIFDEKIKPQMRFCQKLPLMDHAWQSLNVPNLYFSGNMMHSCDYRKGSSGFIHGFRYNIRNLIAILKHRYYDTQLPYDNSDLDIKNITKTVLHKLSDSSALFLQISTLADGMVINKNTRNVKYYHEYRRDYFLQQKGFFSEDELLVTIHLDYGKFYENSLQARRPSKYSEGVLSSYVHPFLTVYRVDKAGMVKKIGLKELREDFFLSWNNDMEYNKILEAYLQYVLNKGFTSDSITHQLTFTTSFPIDKVFRLLGCTIESEEGLKMNFLPLMPFKLKQLIWGFPKNDFGEGTCAYVTYQADDWICRLTKACTTSREMIIEIISPQDNKSLAPIVYKISVDSEKRVTIILEYVNDLDLNLQKQLQMSIALIQGKIGNQKTEPMTPKL